MDVPSMVQRSGDTLIVRSVVSGNQIYVDQGTGNLLSYSSTAFPNLDNYQSRLEFDGSADGIEELEIQNEVKDEGLPQCKIKRNYSCNSCTFFTQNPRHFLTHLRDSHGEKIVINECKLCLYASRHYQKLVRHMKMVHGSTEGIEEHSQARKRQVVGREHRKRKLDLDSFHTPNQIPPQMLTPIEKYEDSLQEEGPQNRLLKCSVCEFTTLYRVQLVEHEQDEHYKTKFFRCEKCSYVTHIKARFSKHVKYHSMPMIKCVTCDFRTPYKWNLDRHMKNHGGTGPFKCAACNFTADIKQSLTVHEMNHHVPPVGHAAGMSMARRKNKVGATDIPEDFFSENGDISDSYNNNNNNVEDFEEPPFEKKFKQEDEDQPTDLSQKGDCSRKPGRPIPNLIPIQTANNALNLTKICEQFNKFVQKGLALPKVSSKDLSSLFLDNGEMCIEKIEGPQLSPSSNCSSSTSKKKGSFFDQLKENFAATVSKNETLLCGCGHASKCLSESIIHQKSCSREDLDKLSSQSPINLSVNSGSTRCQYCRHRCKSSVDLIAHLKLCTEARNCRNESIDSSSNSEEKNENMNCDSLEKSLSQEKHPMENRIFVWNNLSDSQRDDRSYGDQENIDEADDEKPPNDGSKSYDYLSEHQKKENSENSYYGVETAPGYGEVTKKMTPEEEAANSSLKKVYKCPHCSFWASTASRFHVHIVGHLNKKPFECSLCNYRSNWRWDITKHIRLKTIRDPNHKNAKVLMNDETGRRNYTKYNKYITLMKVTEEDGDPKLMKSGEMTPNQEASLAFLNEYKRDSDFTGPPVDTGPPKNLCPIDASRIMRMNFFPNAILGITAAHSTASAPEENKRSIPPLLKPLEDVLTQNIDVKPDGSEKRTMYKCRKCNYRNASRDMVLSHVKGHYQEAGINLSQSAPQSVTNPLQVAVNPSLYMKNVIAAAMCLSQQQLTLNESSPQNQSFISSSASSSPPGPPINRHHHLPIHQNLNLNAIPNHSQQLPPVVNNNTNTAIPLCVGTPPTINQNTINSSNEHGEADEASSGVVTTTGTGVTGWRGPAPYRCGHCHQVSNWKHVIQRHCRLKHNGDIRIETIDRNTDKSTPVYYPLNSQPSSFSSNNVIANVLGGCKGIIANNQSQVFNKDHQQSNQSLHCSQFDPQKTSNEAYKNVDQETASPNIVVTKPRQHQCPSCPFVSDCKSQMMYHNSLHKFKSDLYQCQQCEYTCYKKHVLNQHIKTCHEDQQVLNNDNSTENSTTTDRSISFCSQCPARFIGSKDLSLHLKMHTASNSHRCGVCSYTALQEPSLLAHSTVHSQSYNEKTTQLCRKFATDVHYPRPKLISKALSSGEKVWVVECIERNTESDADLDDKIAKSIICVEDDGGGDRKPSLLKQQLELNGNNNDVTNHYSIERCPHCPFETNRLSDLKSHLQNHICISRKKRSSTCVHCDFSVNDDMILKEHVALHFKLIKNNNVAFYTSYDNLELNLEEVDVECDKTMTRARKQQLLFKSNLANGLDREQQINSKNDNLQQGKTIVDATTGDILSRSSM